MPFKIEGAKDATQAPKGFTIEGAKDAITPKQETPFLQRVGEDFAKRKTQEQEAISKSFLGEQSPASAALQGVGSYMAREGDVIGEAAKSAMSYVPESIKQPVIEKAKQAGKYVAGTDIGKAGIAKAVDAKKAWDEFATNHPEFARNIGGAANIASAFPATGGAAAAKNVLQDVAVSAGKKAAPLLEKAGEAATKAGVKQAAEREAKSLIDLVSPRETKRVAEENVGKTVEKGLLRRQEVIPDKFTQDIASTVGQVPGVSSGRSYQYNYNKIAAENKAEAQKLSATLKAANVTVPPEKINQAVLDVRNSLAKQTFLVGDAKKVSDKMLTEAGSLLQKNGNTADGLLKTRQEFDAWAKGQMGGDPFSDSNKARGASLKAVRDSLNNLIADAVPNALVRQSLTKQFHLYSALDNIKSKAAGEGENIITRGIAKLEDTLPTKNPYLKHAAGLAGLGLAATHPATLAAAVPYAAYKGATSPTTKKVIGKGLTKLSDVLKP